MKKMSFEGVSASACEVISVIVLSTLLMLSVLFSAVFHSSSPSPSSFSSGVRSEFRVPVVALQTNLLDHQHAPAAVVSTDFNSALSSPYNHTVIVRNLPPSLSLSLSLSLSSLTILCAMFYVADVYANCKVDCRLRVRVYSKYI